MIKKIPNLLSVVRVILSVMLLLTIPFSVLFFTIYIMCGFSDILDGFLARKFNLTSELGAVLDSLGDFVMIVILMYVLYPYVNVDNYAILWIIGIMVIRCSSLLVAFAKYRTLAFLHTYTNKVTGFLLFCFPILYISLGVDITAFFLCIIASISALEEFMIHIKSKELDRNISSIFKVLQKK
jgi:phosphatidylglycerophosphate synthase